MKNSKKLVLAVLGGEQNVQAIMQTVIDNLRYALTVDAQTEKVLMDHATMENFVSLLEPIYERAFTENEAAELISFFESDIGKKYIQKVPQMSAEAMRAGEEWGRQLEKLIESPTAELVYN